MNPEVRPVYAHRDEIAARVGAQKAEFIVNQTRNLCLYPNVFLMDQFSTQIRVVRPLAVDKTEVSIFCFAPKGESEADRATRIRQYEDFFNVSGMGTADDLEEFRACQSGYAGTTAIWNDLSRGAPLWIDGPDENAARMGLNPVISGERSEDEGLFVCQHAYWVRTMRDALERERACEAAPAAACMEVSA
jgi:benzoate/toluate 1,2-dioxygenase alpha subunit